MKLCNIKFLLIALIIFAQVYGETDIPADYEYVECTLKSRTRRPSDYAITHPRIPLKAGTSDNWSGYAAATSLTNPQKGSVSYVKGTWNVPSLTKTTNDSFTAIWVGIDGYTSPTVEQLGTEHDWINGNPSYYAWFEMYPLDSFEISGFPLNVGDSITASVKYEDNNVFTLTIMNNTQKKFYTVPHSHTTSAAAQRSSAEWIVEAPFLNNVLPLSHFSQINFTECTTIINNFNGVLGYHGWQQDAITMINDTSNIRKAIPSALTPDAKGFSVVWRHE